MKEYVFLNFKKRYPSVDGISLILSLLMGVVGLFTFIFLFTSPVNAVVLANQLHLDKLEVIEVYQICMNISFNPNFVELSCININK